MSSLRPLGARVAKAELHFRPCERCGQGFGYCHGREPGRRYCFECSPLARRDRERLARRAYRDSDEGRDQHRDEESRRRDRLRSMGDRRCGTEQDSVEVPVSTVAHPAVEERCDDDPQLEWVLVAWPEVLSAAEGLAGLEVRCGCCGRTGRVIEVLVRGSWRRRRQETS